MAPAVPRAVVAASAAGALSFAVAAVWLGTRLPEGASLPVSPYDEVLDFVYDNRNHFAEIDLAAERLAERVGAAGAAASALAALLEERHGVRTETSDAHAR